MCVNERDFWLKPGVEETVSDALKGPAIGTVRRLKMIEKRIEVVKFGTELLPGVSLIDTAGHTPGHASVLLKFSNDSLLIGGDALSHPIISFEQPDWAWGADHDAQMAVAMRKRLLDQLATDQIAILGYHLPWPGVGRVQRKDGRYRYVAG